MGMEQATLFEVMLSELSISLLKATADTVDGEVALALERLGRHFGAQHATLVEFAEGSKLSPFIYTWSDPPSPEPLTTPEMVVSLMGSWYHRTLLAGQTVRLSDVFEQLPPDAEWERKYCLSRDVRSILSVPLQVGDQITCAVSLRAVGSAAEWSDLVVERVGAVGQILANAVYRKRAEEALHARLVEIGELKERIEKENLYLREEIRGIREYKEIVGRSPALRHALTLLEKVAPIDTTVLLLGETGTGKELFAHALHDQSPRKEHPFVTVNCAAIPSSLLESELFGHERGAFTGAIATKLGRFELADGGTLFLDEVGDLEMDLQAKLLRVLQDREVTRVGATRSRKVDVRVVTATNRPLERAMAEGKFRQDLYYRLGVFTIQIPPLRGRLEDIPLLVWAFIQRRQAGMGRSIEKIPRKAMEALSSYSWPGNVRELENVLERALVLSPGKTLRLDEAFVEVGTGARPDPKTGRLDDLERDHIGDVLDRCGWKINGRGNAAEVLGLNPNTLRSRMKKLGIRRPAGGERS
jgi:formate hydrogenlyase transcriptional activator